MIVLILVCVFAASFLLTRGVREYALTKRILDVPNERSSHSAPTPSGGGLAIVAAWFGGAAALIVFGRVEFSMMLALLPPAILLALVGFIDDRANLPWWFRLVVHVLAATWYVFLSGNVAATGSAFIDETPILASTLTVASLVWLINLYNFMDGIDGIAAAEAVFVAFGIAAFAWLSGSPPISALSAILAFAALGFLIWNWPPAAIFMGDTGSPWVGFMLGAIALAASAHGAVAVWPWVILLGVFVVDATVTLVRRLGTGKKWYAAHRSHAYQHLSQRWAGHRPVTLVVCAVNVGWLLPAAIAAYLYPNYGALIAVFALVPLVAIALLIGAGTEPKFVPTDARSPVNTTE